MKTDERIYDILRLFDWLVDAVSDASLAFLAFAG